VRSDDLLTQDAAEGVVEGAWLGVTSSDLGHHTRLGLLDGDHAAIVSMAMLARTME
jgi:hypothetical protein